MADTYTLISSVTVGAGGASSIDFTSIPSTYTDLLLRTSTRSNIAATYDLVNINLNGSGSSFSQRRLYGTGSGTGSASASSYLLYIEDAASDTASTFSNNDIYIPNYANSNYKSYSVDNVTENNATEAYAELLAGLWSNSAAITSISLSLQSGNFVQYSTAYLYGIKNS